MFKKYLRLFKQGVLSINQRNSDYVLRYNKRSLYPLVDNKIKTKELAIQHNIAVPELYEIIKTEGQIQDLNKILEHYNDFVIKPACGSGGDGILVIQGKTSNRYRQINGNQLSAEDLSYHLYSLLSGAYSLGGHQDHAIIERRVIVDEVFADVSYEGVPDIRVIVLCGYPAMAMVRLPTRLSGGKANLHQGAIGAGICLKTGKTLGGVFHNEAVDSHPDTLNSIVDIKVPYWQDILKIAANCCNLTGLGFIGVDIVIDKDKGPLMLELNARPGLNIQIANRDGLARRLKKIERHLHANPNQTINQKIQFSLEAF
jgi:alpha-L-glutamate ligase-like protein